VDDDHVPKCNGSSAKRKRFCDSNMKDREDSESSDDLYYKKVGTKISKQKLNDGGSKEEYYRNEPKVKLRLTDIKSFTTFSSANGDLSAKAFLYQFEQECKALMMPKYQWMDVIPFALKDSASTWFLSNREKINDYDDFRKLFLQYFQSENWTYTRLTRLRTRTFNPRVDLSVEHFVTKRFNEIKEMDEGLSESQICTALIPLLPVSYQRQLASISALELRRILDVVRKLEDIYETNDQKRTNYREEAQPVRKYGFNEVQMENRESPNKSKKKYNNRKGSRRKYYNNHYQQNSQQNQGRNQRQSEEEYNSKESEHRNGCDRGERQGISERNDPRFQENSSPSFHASYPKN
jgi:hypothetical protein